MQIKIIQCPSCGEIQGSMALKVFECKFCGGKYALKHVKILKRVSDAQNAQILISGLKMARAKSKKP